MDETAEEDDHWEEAFLSLEDSDGGFLTSESKNFSQNFLRIFLDLTRLLNEELPISVLQFFKLFFSDANFTRIYHDARNDKGNYR
jgi:hypothetical protein